MNSHFNWIYNNIRINPIDFNGSTWFLANEICAILGYSNPRDAIAKHVKSIDKNTVAIRDGIPGNPNMTIISENGVYDLVFASHMPTAEAFKDYIKTIITSVRQIGYYAEPEVMQQLDANPESVRDLNARAREIIANTKPRMYFLVNSNRFLERGYEERGQQIAMMTPYANLGMMVYAPTACVTLNQLAKILHNATDENNADFGKVNSLLAILRHDGYLIKSLINYNMPTQKSTDNNLMVVVLNPLTRRFVPMVTPTGINYFLHHYIYNTIEDHAISDEEIMAMVGDPFEERVPTEEIPVIETVDK